MGIMIVDSNQIISIDLLFRHLHEIVKPIVKKVELIDWQNTNSKSFLIMSLFF